MSSASHPDPVAATDITDDDSDDCAADDSRDNADDAATDAVFETGIFDECFSGADDRRREDIVAFDAGIAEDCCDERRLDSTDDAAEDAADDRAASLDSAAEDFTLSAEENAADCSFCGTLDSGIRPCCAEAVPADIAMIRITPVVRRTRRIWRSIQRLRTGFLRRYLINTREHSSC